MRLPHLLLVIASLLLRLAVCEPVQVSETSEEFLLRHQRARGGDGLAPLYGTDHADRFPEEYRVMFHPGYTLLEHFESIGMDLSNATRFRQSGSGYRAKLDDITLNSHVRLDPGVLLVETNGPMELVQPVESYTNDSAAFQAQKRDYVTAVEQDVPYGLQMISAAGKLKTPVSDDGNYNYVWGAGRGVNVYIFDTGIRTSHKLFGGRATHFGGAAPRAKSKYTDEINDDRTGHGTHVAGIIGAYKYGVAPFANLISVKVMGEGESQDKLQDALIDVIAEHNKNKRQSGNSKSPWDFRGSIINLSMTWTFHAEDILWQLIQANEAGITVFAAAGNMKRDASQFVYPCSYPQTLCIGAAEADYKFDKRYSNFGKVVDYLAPGAWILSLGIKNDEDVNHMTGTSMACPHAAGAAAIFVHWLGLTNNQAPKYVAYNALSDIVSGVPKGTGSYLINTGIHSPIKWPFEPFRWAGEFPGENHNHGELRIVTTTDISSVASGLPLTGIDTESYNTMRTTTVSDPTGLSTEAGDTTWDPSFDGPTSSTSIPAQTTTPVPSPGGVAGQQIALFTNIDPDADPDAWHRLIAYDSNKISVLIADPQSSGSDSEVDLNLRSLINTVKSSGKRIIGYVDTGYLGASEQLLTTRLGSVYPADWVAQIERDVDKWYRLYGSGIGGIFFDQAQGDDCGPDNRYSDLYAYINAYTKRRYPGAYTVLHTGLNTSQCYENTMDTLLTFTDSYDIYTSSYTPLDWTPADPRKIWHIIDSVPASAVGSVVDLAGQRGAGLIEVTDDTPDNPYDTLPDDAYMQDFMKSVQGGSAPVTDAPASADGPAADAPESLTVTSYGYSSVSLFWNESANLNAVGYNVYLNGWQVASLPSYMTRVTVGDMTPGLSALSFSVKAIGGGNIESEGSTPVSVSTLSLPGGRPIINAHAEAQDGFTTYTADILVGYSSVRVFVTYWDWSGTCDFQNDPAWPMYYNTSGCYCAVAMVRNGNLYRYNGTITDPEDNIPWAWDWVGPAPLTQDGYTHSWVAPIGSSTMDTTSFVISGQGHGPGARVFSPCPNAGESPDTGIFCA